MEIKLDVLDTKRAIINQNGAIYGLKKYAGYEAIVAIISKKQGEE
jgi:hypothetical protein